MSLPTNPPRRATYWQRRFARHAKLALASLLIGAIVWPLTAHRSLAEGLSFATAYAGFILLAVALAVGPVNVLRRRPNPVSTDLRRDIGIWAGLSGVAHTIAGLQVHMHGDFVRYFAPAPGVHADRSAKAFFSANYLGLAAAILLLVLVSISNDIALRKLGVPRWKLVQRSTYVVLAAVIIHGALYQLLEKRAAFLVIVFGAIALIVVALQLAGLRPGGAGASVRIEDALPPEGADPQ